MRRRRSRRRIAVARTPIPKPEGSNNRWSSDFVHGQLASGAAPSADDHDDITKECLAAVPDTSISGKWILREMAALITRRGKPDVIVSDSGTELPARLPSASKRTGKGLLVG